MDGSELNLVYDGSSSGARWLPDGSAVIFLRYKGHLRDLMMIKIDRKSGEPRGQPIQLLTGLKSDGGCSISADGRSIVFVEKIRYSNVPAPLRGVGITFIVTGLMGIAFMTFMGIKL